jgi:hypothetical protein
MYCFLKGKSNMKSLLIATCCLCVTSVMAAEDRDYGAELREKGHTQCIPALKVMAKMLSDNEGQFFSLWNVGDPNKHMASLLGGKIYSDGSAVLNMTATPTPDGGCDAGFTMVVTFSNKSCPEVRDTVLKDWKYTATMANLPFYDDPTSSNITVVLAPAGANCTLSKIGVLFFDKKLLEELSVKSSDQAKK